MSWLDADKGVLFRVNLSYFPDEHGCITKEDFKESLQFFTGRVEDGAGQRDFDVLWKLVEAKSLSLQGTRDSSDSCVIDFPLFCEIIRRCKLLLLYKMNVDHSKCSKTDHSDCPVVFVKSSLADGGNGDGPHSVGQMEETRRPIIVTTYEEDDFEVSDPLTIEEYVCRRGYDFM